MAFYKVSPPFLSTITDSEVSFLCKLNLIINFDFHHRPKFYPFIPDPVSF